VPYTSLSWCHTWHVGDVKTDEVATKQDRSSRIGGLLDMLGMRGLVYGEQRFVSAGKDSTGRMRHTSVMEYERVNHRDIIRHEKLRTLVATELSETFLALNKKAALEEDAQREESLANWGLNHTVAPSVCPASRPPLQLCRLESQY
jgi:hypothetical protein